MSEADASAVVRCARDGRWEGDDLRTRLRLQIPLLRVWARREFSIRYRQSALGIVWSFLQPLSTLLIFGFLLSGVLHVGSEGFPYICFAYAGLVPWTFMLSGITGATQSLLGAGGIVSKVYFPREVIPLAVIGASTVDLALNTGLLLVLLVAQGVGLGVTLVALPLVFLVAVVWTAAVGVFAAAFAVFFRDVRHGLPLLMQLVFIASPVMYAADLLPERLRWTTTVNPVAVIVESSRDVALRHQWPGIALLVHGLIGVALLILAVTYVRSTEPRIVDVA